MDAAHPLLLKLVASSVRIADRAGTIVRNIMSAGNLGIVDKGINDLQTEADRSVQRCIMASLHKQFPDLTVIGEEDKDVKHSGIDADWIETTLAEDVLKHSDKFPANLSSVVNDDICVWVDPLDGTAEYTQGLLDHVTVLIGIAVKGEAVAGVIHQPYFNYEHGPDAQLGRTIWGIVGLGSFGFELKPPKADERIVVTTRSHETEGVRNAIAACQPTSVVKVGGAGHKVLLLIEGKAHAYIFASPGCKKWDTCAPEAVLRAIGGTLTDIHGSVYRYDASVNHQNSGGVLATSQGQPHDWFLGKIPADVMAVK